MRQQEMAHNLNDADKQILRVLTRGRGEGTPWGRDGPSYIANELDYSTQYVHNRLQMLSAGEFVHRRSRGVYEITEKGIEAVEDE